MTNEPTNMPKSGGIALSSGELLALCQSFSPGQDLDLARAVQDALLRKWNEHGHAANEWADMATNGMQWVRNIQDGFSTPAQALAALQSDLAHCRNVQARANAAPPGAGPINLAALEDPEVPSQEVDERAAWASDMIAAGAQHLGGESWEWDVEDFEFRLWQIARRRRPQAVPPRESGSLERYGVGHTAPVPAGTGVESAAHGRQYHLLKTDPAVFQAVLSGTKTFEIRFNDRGFAVGDVLGLRETRHTGAEMRAGAPLVYTGRECQRFVSHVLTGYGLAEGWCCLSFVLPHAGGASAPRADIRDELNRLGMMAHTAMNQNAGDKGNVMEDIAERLVALAGGAPVASAPVAVEVAPVAWAAVHWAGKREGRIYSTCDTREEIEAYIQTVHQSSDSLTLYARPLSFADAGLTHGELRA